MTGGLRVGILRQRPYVPSEGYEHKYGGLPTFTDHLPECKVCRRPLTLFFQFDLSDPQLQFLRLSKMRFLPVLSCMGCDLSYAGHLFYRVEGPAITVLHSDAVTTFEEWENACPERNILIGPIPPEQLPSHYDSTDDWETHMMELEVPKHQLGGTPYWVQDEHECICPECGQSMRFIGQVDSETWPVSERGSRLAGHMFGDSGILYVFYCGGCNIVGTGGDCY